jgi:hypothetical protein
MSEAANAIVSWSKVKTILGFEDDTMQAYVEELVGFCSTAMETAVLGVIKAQSLTRTIDGNGRQDILLPSYPVTAAAFSIDSSRVFGPETAISDVQVYLDSGIAYRAAGWPVGRQNIKVVMTAGYAVIPADLVDACIRLVGKSWSDYKEKRLGIKAATGMDGNRMEYEVGIPLDVWKTLERYRRVAV